MTAKFFWRVLLSAAILAGIGTASLSAQNTEIRGTVVDETGNGVIGAGVIQSGTTNGTTTDLDGHFSITVPQGSTLSFSCIGYVSQELPATQDMRVVLATDNLMLEETIVVGYGVQKKSVVTASIASVSSESLDKVASQRVDQALKGLAAGVNVTSSSGQPGAASRIRIRGTGTINNSDPLYIVDGMPIEGGIDYLNPSDIESIEVLKDAASGAVYGARAANGVILVTTKKGEKGRVRVNYDFSYGISSPWKERDVLNASEYALMQNEGRINAGMVPVYNDPWSYGEGTNWQKEVFNYNAPQQKHELSVSGGSEKVNYYLSLGYLNQEGIVGGNYGRSNYDRLTLRSNTSYVLLDKKDERSYLNNIVLSSNLSYAKIASTGIETNSTWGSPLGSALALSPILGVYATDEQLAEYASLYAGQTLLTGKGGTYMVPGGSYNEMVNPVASLSLPASKGWSHKVVGNFSGELQIWDNLRFKSTFGVDMSFWGSDGYTPLFYLGTNNKSDKTIASSESDHSTVWQLENTLTYNKEIGLHNFTVLLGQSAKGSNGQYLGGSRYDLKSYKKPYIDYAEGLQEDGRMSVYGAPYAKSRLASYFFRADYNYAERYMAEVTVRRDGSSRFGSENHWATFPSFSLGWNVHNEPYVTLPSWWNMLKVRGSWGENGNENIGNFRYTVLTESNNNYIFGKDETVTTGTKAGGIANEKLKWETSRQTDIGVDMAFLRSALTLTVDWYRKVTDGMLMEMNIPSYVGESKPIGNVGKMRNSGLEVIAGYKFDLGKDWHFSVGGNISTLSNKLIEYGNESGWANLDSFQGTGTISRAQNGKPFPFFYGYKTDGIFQNNAEIASYTGPDGTPIQPNAAPGDVRFVDINGDGVINDDDRTDIGNGTPDWTWGINFSAQWKNFDFSMLWQGTVGNDIFDATRRTDIASTNLPAYMLNRWTGEGTSNKYPRYVIGDSVNWLSSDLYIYDGSYARLKDIQIGYTLPENITRKAFISRLRLYVAAENLLTLTSYHGYDPEISSGGTSLGIDYGVYPQARTFIFGVTVGF